ncbi:MAG TPA: acyl-CoA dehydrogenase family protein [Mycobacteriales bacterium]|nr:acyl-CoA dehydrogenase family protein [Mycobacteriales bacterium]
MTAVAHGETLVLSGRKKPCSLARSMDLLTASVSVPRADGDGQQLAVALIPRATPGVEVRPFWNSFVLAGAESDEVVLTDVEVPPDLVVRTEAGPGDTLDSLQTTGFLWFELLMAASYLGMASALAERVLSAGRADVAERGRPRHVPRAGRRGGVRRGAGLPVCRAGRDRPGGPAQCGGAGRDGLHRLPRRSPTWRPVRRPWASIRGPGPGWPSRWSTSTPASHCALPDCCPRHSPRSRPGRFPRVVTCRSLQTPTGHHNAEW